MRTIAFAVLLLPACMSYDVQRRGAVDLTAKTIAVPAQGDGLCGSLKSALRADGWRTFDAAPPARYRLEVDSSYEDFTVFSARAIYSFTVTVIDTIDGSPIVTVSGRGTEGGAAERLLAALRDEGRKP